MGGSSNRSGRPNIIIIHTGEGILNRNDMAAFLERTAGISAHATSDAGGVAAPLVSYDRAAWAAGPTGNNRGIQIELCAFAQMTRDQWLSKNDVTIWVPWLNANRVIRSPYSMLQHTANWARAVANQYGIPLKKLNSAELRAGHAGITGHADVSAAWGESDHTDPGSGFPWDVFMQLVNGQETRREKEIMAGMAKGNKRAEIYMVTVTPEGIFKRHIREMAEVEFWQKQGMVVATVDQAWIDKQWDSVESVESKTKFALDQLLDDEVNIIKAVRNMPTGGQVDIPSFVAALTPVLIPALPEGVTKEQVKEALTETLEKSRLSVD